MTNSQRTKAKLFILDRINEIETNISSIIGSEAIRVVQAEKSILLNEENDDRPHNSNLKVPTLISKSFLE